MLCSLIFEVPEDEPEEETKILYPKLNFIDTTLDLFDYMKSPNCYDEDCTVKRMAKIRKDRAKDWNMVSCIQKNTMAYSKKTDNIFIYTP